MKAQELHQLLQKLISDWESELVEFKEANDNFSTEDIGKYFSALSNEANLAETEKAWLIFGVNNKTKTIVGTDYRSNPERLQSLKEQIFQSTEPNISFRNIHELDVSGARVLLFEIPAAPRGMPVSWKAQCYGRVGESIRKLSQDKQDEIRNQTLNTDWSAQVVPNAKIDDLDSVALKKARDSFILKHANRFSAEEVGGWSASTFLNRAKITIDSKITRTALLLLGKPESAYLLSPHPAQMTWKLDGEERAYEHFSPPFLLTTTQLYQKIRNIQIRLLPVGELLPHEISKYDQRVVLEALHNCIAHQDYNQNGRINVIEKPDKLIFENEGNFFEGVPEDYILSNKVPRRYRNSFLVEAMVTLSMVDKMGFGIHDMNKLQAGRYLPLPDYDLSEKDAVRTTIYGSVVDPAYSRLLMQKTNLALEDILALDRVQKDLPISDSAAKRLKHAQLIEGRKPNFHVSAVVANVTKSKVDYLRTRGLDDSHYMALIKELVIRFKSVSREEIDRLLIDKLSDALNYKQKKEKINNLLSNLRRAGYIKNTGSRTKSSWAIAERLQKEMD